MTVLLDANVLIALLLDDHVHHQRAGRWYTDTESPIATCPITEGSLVRLMVREGRGAMQAIAALATLHAEDRHVFWSADLSMTEVDPAMLLGHRQVTDAYLAQLARSRSGRLVTFDRGLAAGHADVVDLLGDG